MRHIPSNLPPPVIAPDALDVKNIRYLRPVLRVDERNLTPLVFPHLHSPEQADVENRTSVPSVAERRRGKERRNISRRTRRKGRLLYDTRASEDRRGANRRDGDLVTKIQEKI